VTFYLSQLIKSSTSLFPSKSIGLNLDLLGKNLIVGKLPTLIPYNSLAGTLILAITKLLL
jgi:hypothetical protein